MTHEERRKQDRADLGAIFRTREGARFFSALLDLCGVFRLSYQGEETHAAAFKEGARNVGLQVLHALEEIDPQARQRLRDADTEREVTRNDEDDEFQWV